MRKRSRAIAVTGCMAALAGVANACFFQADSVTYMGEKGGGGASSAISGSSSSASGASCPNGKIDSGETCDDGNAMAGDGCDANCQKEECWDCPGEGEMCTAAMAGTGCKDGQYCDGSGVCGAWGAPCDSTRNCANGDCVNRTCRLLEGAPCTDDVQCATNRCSKDTRLCEKCSNNNADMKPCNANVCNGNGSCAAAIGEPCGNEIDCADNTTTVCSPGHLCVLKNNQECTKEKEFECASKFCDNNTCDSCNTTNKKCTNAAQCFSGACLAKLPTGAYCINSDDCVTGKQCIGFPRRCE